MRNTDSFRLRTNLIVHDGIADVFDQATQFIRIHDIVEEALGLPLAFQLFELVGSFIQFPSNSSLSGSGLGLGKSELTVPVSLSFLAP